MTAAICYLLHAHSRGGLCGAAPSSPAAESCLSPPHCSLLLSLFHLICFPPFFSIYIHPHSLSVIHPLSLSLSLSLCVAASPSPCPISFAFPLSFQFPSSLTLCLSSTLSLFLSLSLSLMS